MNRPDDWRDRARCKGVGPELFFGAHDESHADRVRRERNAKAMCLGCDVVADCLASGQGEEGIWGGMTDSERRRATQRSRYSPPKIIVVPDVTADSSPEEWTPLEHGGDAILFRRDSTASWHGSEFMVVKSAVVVKITMDLADAYATYGRVLG